MIAKVETKHIAAIKVKMNKNSIIKIILVF